MKTRSRYTLQRTMIIYFLLIGFASLLVGIEFMADTHRPELKEQLLSNFQAYSQNQIPLTDVFAPIDDLRNKGLLMIGIILFVMVIVLTMFIKNITEPLQHMIEVSQRISKGDLSRTVTIESNNELAELGTVINEMTSNLQEMILHSRNMCLSGQAFIDKTAFLENPGELSTAEINMIRQHILNLKKEINLLTELISFFSFYTLENQMAGGDND